MAESITGSYGYGQMQDCSYGGSCNRKLQIRPDSKHDRKMIYVNWKTYGISSGNKSAKMLTDSVFALDVGAAARSIFSSAI